MSFKPSQINILGQPLNYIKKGDMYIATFISDIKNDIYPILEAICNFIFPQYASRNLQYANVCGPNATYICNKKAELIRQIRGLEKVGKIYISDVAEPDHWKHSQITEANRKLIESVYGNTYGSIGASYHALVYFKIIIIK